MSTTTFRDRVALYFQARPDQWIDGRELAQIGGAYAWRSRVSDCRVDLGMTIVNRTRRVGRAKVSEYCYQPEPVRPPDVYDANAWSLR